MGLVEDKYDRNKMSIKVNHMGNLGKKEFHHISCRICDEIVLPELKSQYNFKESTSLTELIDNWDAKKINMKYLDMAGCFFPWEKHVHAGPNGRRFIARPEQHELCTKIKKSLETKSSSSNLKTNQEQPQEQPLESNATITTNKIGNMVVSQVVQNDDGDKISVGKKTRDGAKFGSPNIANLLDPKITLKGKPEDKADIWSK